VPAAYLKALQMSGRLIARIHEDLSFLLLREKDVQRSHLERVDVAQNIRESVAFFSILSERKRIEVHVRCEPCFVEADPHHIDLLVKNLIDNAIKYTKQGGRIDIALEGCRLRIEDTGIGIPREKLKRIFERYQRGSDLEGGFGIGLNIVETICRMYGYGLHVSSEEGRGSVFSVDFKS
jgi:two-component system OmpR family sensor kinase